MNNHDQAIKDVAERFGFVDAESCRARIEKYPTRGLAYAVSQRERVLELEAERQSARKLALEGAVNIAMDEARRTTDDESISTCKIISVRIRALAAPAPEKAQR